MNQHIGLLEEFEVSDIRGVNSASVALVAGLAALDMLVLRFMCRMRQAWKIRSDLKQGDPHFWRPRSRRAGTLPPLDAVLPRIGPADEHLDASPLPTIPEQPPLGTGPAEVPAPTRTPRLPEDFEDDPYLVPIAESDANPAGLAARIERRDPVRPQAEIPAEGQETVVRGQPIADHPRPRSSNATPTFVITVGERSELQKRVTDGDARARAQALALLKLSDGASAQVVAEELCLHPTTIRRWRRAFVELRDGADAQVATTR